jgi:glycosyltransferase involved in cell wall biosynthesis
MKVLFIANSEKIGGGNKSLLALCESLSSQGHQPSVIVPKKGQLQELLHQKSIKYFLLSTRFYDLPTLQIAQHIFRAFFIIRNLRPDVIHANDVYCYKYFAKIARFLKIPIVCHFRHFIDSNMAGYLLDVQPDLGIFNSVYNQKRTLECGGQSIKNMNARVIYNFFDSNDYYQPPKRPILRNLFSIADDVTVFLVIGNINPGKGHLDLIQSIHKMKLDNLLDKDKIKFLIVGEDVTGSGLGEKMMEQVEDLGLNKLIIFAGFQDDNAAAYAGADWVVIPSSEEPFGRVAVEAILARKPVVARNNSGLSEILSDLNTPILTNDDTVIALTKAIQKALITNIDQTLLLEDAEKVAQRFSKENQFDILLNEVYLNLAPIKQ